jgi:hypothetical protein
MVMTFTGTRLESPSLNAVAHTLGPHSLEEEAAALGRHLAGREIDDESVRRYADAIRRGVAPMDAREGRLLRRVVRRPWMLGFIDAGLALWNRRGPLRRRLVVMFAILESSPRYCDLFLPRPTSTRVAIGVAWAAIRAVTRAAVGAILVAVLR